MFRGKIIAVVRKGDRMDDLISRQAAIELIERMKPYHQGADDIAEMIANMPSAQPERKTGKWIQKGLKWECDQCGCRIGRAKPFSGNMWNYYYCPNCGVKMEEGEQDGQTN